jgi:hypothetical protein
MKKNAKNGQKWHNFLIYEHTKTCVSNYCVRHEEQTRVKSVSKKHDGKNKQRQEEQTLDFTMKRKLVC